MKAIKIFHYLSYCAWIFLAWGIILMVQAFLHPQRYALANTGLAVFLMGLFLGFLGFGDIEKLSEKEKKKFANPRTMKITSVLMLSLSAYIFIMGIYFMNIKWLQPAIKETFEIEFRTIGYHCFALGFGFLCYLKLLFDKYKYYLSLSEGPRSAGAGR
jgi:archaellum biogenesis protein FlaJ (TadC family)